MRIQKTPEGYTLALCMDHKNTNISDWAIQIWNYKSKTRDSESPASPSSVFLINISILRGYIPSSDSQPLTSQMIF